MANLFVIHFILLRDELNITNMVKPASFLFYLQSNKISAMKHIVSAFACYAIC